MKTEIKIDQSSLPADGQKVIFQYRNTKGDLIEKKGIYNDSEQMFCEGFCENVGHFKYAFDVDQWEPIKYTDKEVAINFIDKVILNEKAINKKEPSFFRSWKIAALEGAKKSIYKL